MALARTQYVRSGDVALAYQVLGGGPHDLVLVFDWANHLEAIAEHPLMVEFLRPLARWARVLWFDMRGVGMSDGVAGGTVPAEEWMADVTAVMDVAGSSRTTLVAQGHAAQMAVLAAAAHPERIASLVLLNGFARLARADDYRAGMPEAIQQAVLANIEEQWGSGALAAILGPSVADRPELADWWGRVERFGSTPALARKKMQAVFELDVRRVLAHVAAPTLVVHNRDNQYVRVEHGRYLAAHIPGARLLERESGDHFPLPDPDLLGAIEEFVTGSRTERDDDRFLATVLFVDVVGSTAQASELGDERWRAFLDQFEETVCKAVLAYGGQVVDTAGDGILATFDGPARGIRCALRIRDEVRRVGLEVRGGLHSGELTRRGGKVAGISVHVGARVAAVAKPGEVLVTRTVRDLVAGSGIAFEEHGEHALKGVPERWSLYGAVG